MVSNPAWTEIKWFWNTPLGNPPAFGLPLFESKLLLPTEFGGLVVTREITDHRGLSIRLLVGALIGAVAALALAACQTASSTGDPARARSASKTVPEIARDFGIVGHRGARGLIPENNLPGFAKAMSVGVTAIELDVGVSRDGTVVVSHDQKLNPNITRMADGSWLSSEGKAITQLTLAELKTYDVGRLNRSRRYYESFMSQKAVDGARMPTLREVIALVRKAGNNDLRFDVEIKGSPEKPSVTLEPKAYAEKVVKVLREEGVEGRASILSFDWRTLRHVQSIAPNIPTVCLSAQFRNLDNLKKGQPGPSPWTAGLDVDDRGGSVPKLVEAAGCKVWSVYHKELGPAQLEEAHFLGLKVLVWTVNHTSDMKNFIKLGVDGIVTDYPDKLRRVLQEMGASVPSPTPVPSPQ